jgi:hypothetical protein
MWSSRTIASSLKTFDLDQILEPHFIHLALFDPQNQQGVGIDGKGQIILVLPGQEDVTSFRTEYASYDPWSNFIDVATNHELKDVAILRCDVDLNDNATIEAAAAIFSGLLDLQNHFGKTGQAIWKLKSLFSNRLNFEVPDFVITGFLGEILILLKSSNPDLAVKYWHSKIDDRYDYSGSDFRLEIKSTAGIIRHHHFTSHQIPGDVPTKTFVASVKISKVEKGENLVHVFRELEQKLGKDDYAKVVDLSLSVLGVPINLLLDYQFDLTASLDSIGLIAGTEVPCPTVAEGVISMEWIASLDQSSNLTSFYEDFFEQNQ